MADESLLELERVLRAAPDDEQTRRRLVSLLARSGRRREALEHAELLPDARDATNGLWREELERLERTVAAPGAHEVTDVALDPNGDMVAWSSNREGFHVAAVKTGALVHSAAGQRQDRLLAVPGKVFCKDHVRGPITAIEWAQDGVRVTRRNPQGALLDVSPAGDLVLVEGNQTQGVYTWPALGAVIEQPSRLNAPVVDWETRRLLVNGLRGLEVFPFVGPAHATLEGRTTVSPVVLGGGLVARFRPGLVLHSLAGTGNWMATLYEQRGSVAIPYARPSLSGRFVRLVLGGVPVRFEVDLATGAVLSRPERVERLALSQTSEDRPGEVLWHPHADLVLQRRRGGHFELRTLEGETVMRLPQASFPHSWTRDGRGLLTLRGAGEGRSWLELWRC